MRVGVTGTSREALNAQSGLVRRYDTFPNPSPNPNPNPHPNPNPNPNPNT
jgi:hypothetical protein